MKASLAGQKNRKVPINPSTATLFITNTNSVFKCKTSLVPSWSISTFQYHPPRALSLLIIFPSHQHLKQHYLYGHLFSHKDLISSQQYLPLLQYMCQFMHPDYSFCNHSSEIYMEERDLPTPLWASKLVNSTVPLWPFLGFSLYCLWFPLGQYL